MKTGTLGLSIIKQCETCRLTAFKPTPDDVWTIGWGHTKGVSEGDTCTQESADEFLAEDLAEAEAAVNKMVTVPLNQNQFDALVSFVYNEGAHALEISTLLHKLNALDYIGAAAEFPRWNKQRKKDGSYVVLNGLVKRRDLERTLFERPA